MNRSLLNRGTALLAYFGWPRRKPAPRKPATARPRRLIVERLEQKQLLTALFWDPGQTAGRSLGGSGTWSDGGAAEWFNPATGRDVAWNNTALDTAHFSGTPGSIGISGQISAASLVFDVDGNAISGGSLLVESSGMSIVVNSSTATIASVLTGSGQLTTSGQGTVMLTATNTYTGGTQIASGTLLTQGQGQGLPSGDSLSIGNAAAFNQQTATDLYWDPGQTAGQSLGGDGAWTDGGAAVWYNPATGQDVAWSNAAQDTAHFSGTPGSITILSQVSATAIDFQSEGNSLSGGVIVLPDAGTSIEIDSGTATIASTLIGAGSLTKTGAGTVALTANNTYSGDTTVDQGVLQTSMAAEQNTSVQYVLSDLQPGGTYEVYVTWTPSASLSADVPYQVLDGGASLGTVLIDQQTAPSGPTIDGVAYQSLGQYLVTSGALTISMLSTSFGAASLGGAVAQQRTGGQINPQSTYEVRLLEAGGSPADVGDPVPLTVGVSTVNPTGSAYVQDINDGTVQAGSWEEAVDLLVLGEAQFGSTTVNFPDDLAATPGFMVGTVAELSNIPGNELGTTVGLAADTKVIALECGSYANNATSPNVLPSNPPDTSADYDDGYWIVSVTIVPSTGSNGDTQTQLAPTTIGGTQTSSAPVATAGGTTTVVTSAIPPAATTATTTLATTQATTSGSFLSRLPETSPLWRIEYLGNAVDNVLSDLLDPAALGQHTNLLPACMTTFQIVSAELALNNGVRTTDPSVADAAITQVLTTDNIVPTGDLATYIQNEAAADLANFPAGAEGTADVFFMNILQYFTALD